MSATHTTALAQTGQLTPDARKTRYDLAFSEIDPPFAFVDLDAMWINSQRMLGRAQGKPIRIASKSLRCRPLVKQILNSNPGYRGQLCFTLPEAIWLNDEGADDLVVAYPSTDREALRQLAIITAQDPQTAPVIMVDSTEHLDLIDEAVPTVKQPLRVCIDLDASWWLALGKVRIGAKRTPVHHPAQARALAERIVDHPKTTLVGIMCYEGHIAGTADVVPNNPIKTRAIAGMQRASYEELKTRRAEAVARVEVVAGKLEFVNAGGTGDLEKVAGEPAMTEATAGSGFYAPTLFDNYSSFSLEPAAMFALPVCRRPGTGYVTALGGGYLASGSGAKDRMPSPYLPTGLKLDPLEGTGEVQTPLKGEAADGLRLGDKVYFRHAKAGELCERFDRLYLVEGNRIVDELPTYRGEGKTFL
jgi:D-serine deaminase-like pyridoxal phosphate-dependent protein